MTHTLANRIAKCRADLEKEMAKGLQANERRMALLRMEIGELERDQKSKQTHNKQETK